MRPKVAFSIVCLILLPIWPSSAVCAQEPPARVALPGINSPNDLWRGIDVESAPLDVESIRAWQDADGSFETLRFTGETAGKARVRVYSIQGAPREGKKLPGVLHIHGGGQTASLDWVRFWAKRGYVCVSFDFCGPWADRKDVTDWGPIRQGNMADAAGGFQLRPTPRESSWFHWALVARRALTLLGRHPQVDPARLGIFGISVGGSLTWMVAATDSRVKAAVPIYGCGYNYDRRNVRWGFPPPSDDLILFQRILSPEAHAPLITCPLLFLSATNDFHGLMDRSFEAIDAVQGSTWQAFTPRTNHHIEPHEGRNLALWMDTHLTGGPAWPKAPGLRFSLDAASVTIATISAESEVAEVSAYYCLGEKRPQARYWRTASVARTAAGWQAQLPVVDVWDDLRAFANVTFKSGVCLSTPLGHVIPAQLGKALPTLSPGHKLEDGSNGLDPWVFTNGYTDPSLDWSYLEFGRDERVGPYVTFNLKAFGDPIEARLSSHIVGAPGSQGRDGEVLMFQCRGKFTDDGLTVSVVQDDWGIHSRTYSAKVARAELGDDWREISLPLARFLDKDGKSPARWRDLDKLEIQAKAARSGPPCFARFRWFDPDL